MTIRVVAHLAAADFPMKASQPAKVEHLNDVYRTRPLSSPLDPLQMSTQDWTRKLSN